MLMSIVWYVAASDVTSNSAADTGTGPLLHLHLQQLQVKYYIYTYILEYIYMYRYHIYTYMYTDTAYTHTHFDSNIYRWRSDTPGYSMVASSWHTTCSG